MDVEARLARFLSRTPDTGRAAFIAQNAVVVGDVHLGENSSVWYGSVLRADIQRIVIGPATNLQDGVIIHLSDDHGVQVGEYATVGHRAILHACSVGNESLIGMGSILLDGAEIGNQCIVGAGALVTQNFKAPDGSMIYGSPARIVRSLKEEERRSIRGWAEKYVRVATAHADASAGSANR